MGSSFNVTPGQPTVDIYNNCTEISKSIMLLFCISEHSKYFLLLGLVKSVGFGQIMGFLTNHGAKMGQNWANAPLMGQPHDHGAVWEQCNYQKKIQPSVTSARYFPRGGSNLTFSARSCIVRWISHFLLNITFFVQIIYNKKNQFCTFLKHP